MTVDEFLTKYSLEGDEAEELKKIVQGAGDSVRTEYSKKLKDAQTELEQYKPHEKTDTEKQLEATQNELKALKFEKSLRDIGVNDDLAKYLNPAMDMDAFKTFYEGYKQSTEKRDDYIAKNHQQNTGVSKEDFKRMSYAEKAKLYTENPTLYKSLSE